MENNNNDVFSYPYSAKEQAEIRKIREKYASGEQEEDKMARLRRLDASVTGTAQAVALALGVLAKTAEELDCIGIVSIQANALVAVDTANEGFGAKIDGGIQKLVIALGLFCIDNTVFCNVVIPSANRGNVNPRRLGGGKDAFATRNQGLALRLAVHAKLGKGKALLLHESEALFGIIILDSSYSHSPLPFKEKICFFQKKYSIFHFDML